MWTNTWIWINMHNLIIDCGIQESLRYIKLENWKMSIVNWFKEHVIFVIWNSEIRAYNDKLR